MDNKCGIMEKNVRSICHVPGCVKQPNCSLHKLPPQTERRGVVRRKWMEVLHLDPKIPTDLVILVCGQHFTDDDYVGGGGGSMCRNRLQRALFSDLSTI